MSEEKLTDFLKKGKDWYRLKTSIPGIYVLKLPAYKTAPTRLAVELNPADDAGRPKKRRGLVIRTSNELEEFKQLFQYDRLSKFLGMLDQVNPKVEALKPMKGETIIEL